MKPPHRCKHPNHDLYYETNSYWLCLKCKWFRYKPCKQTEIMIESANG